MSSPVSAPRRPPSSVPAAATLLLAASSLFAAGCTGASQPNASWPEQPSPSYPKPGTETTALGEAEPLVDPGPEKAKKASPAPPSSSTLAKDYTGKKPLDAVQGKATYYADSLAGNHTANGDVYDPAKYTAAHRNLPFGTVLRVVRQDSDAETYVRVNDRGPFGSKDRIIDLSKAAAKELDMLDSGVVGVRVEILEKPSSD